MVTSPVHFRFLLARASARQPAEVTKVLFNLERVSASQTVKGGHHILNWVDFLARRNCQTN